MAIEVSVIVPVYNDPEDIQDTLESLVNQDFGGNYEILPVDNNSTDKTGEVIQEFEEEYPELVRGLEENEIQSSYAARNKGINEAEGDILCFLDADMWVEEKYLSKVVSYFEDSPQVDYIGCDVELVSNKDSLASRYNFLSGFPVEDYIEESNFAPTCCLAVRKSVFDTAGLFDDRLVSGGDMEFGERVKQTGLKQEYADGITLYHPTRGSLRSLLKKSFRVGKGHGQIDVYRPEESSKRSYFHPANFLPMNPFSFKNYFSQNSEHSLRKREIPVFFLIYYILKLVKSYSRLKYNLQKKLFS